MRHLMCLVSVEHHLLISPLCCELCISSRIIIRVGSMHLTLSWMHGIRLLVVVILIEGWIKRLRAMWWGIPCWLLLLRLLLLLLLNGVGIRLLLGDGGWSGIVCRRGTLARNGGRISNRGGV